MAIVKSHSDQVNVNDGDPIMEACEDLGVPFGCTSGVCGTCEVTVLEGMDNLNPLTDSEVEFGLTDSQRLMCQCIVKGGEVKIDY